MNVVLNRTVVVDSGRQVFAGLRLTVPTAYISVVSGNSAQLVFNFFFVSYPYALVQLSQWCTCSFT